MSERIPYTLSESSICVFWEGKPYTIRKDNVNFENLKQAIFDARYEDVPQYLDIVKAVENFVEGDIEVRDEVVYYKSHRLHGVVVNKLLEMLRAGMKDSAPLTNFISRLQANPSANSVNELYSFMNYKMLPNTPEGKVLGYKGVQSDYWSTTGNADTIVLQGKTNERHQILNEVGTTIEVQRRCVDDNKDNHCSFGLHVGSYDYADSWAGDGGRLLVVEFDPADAVSVPTDCDFQKLRVSKYKVVEDITEHRKEMNKPVYEANKPIYGSNNDNDYEIEDEDEGRDYLYDDDGIDGDYDMDQTDSDVESRDSKEFFKRFASAKNEEDFLTHLAIRNYVDNKHDKGINPSVKQVRSLQVVRDAKFDTAQVGDILDQLGFNLDGNGCLTDKLVLRN
tara:strand:- start:9505 stop:10683 length:1179 start_codon:yes stop_codon:yes gene_type:complete